MALVAVSKGRAKVSSEVGGLKIVIPSRKNWFLIIFVFGWLGAWFFGEASAIRDLANPELKGKGFLAFWLIAWTAGGIFAAVTWLWSVAGKEILAFGGGTLTYHRAVGALKFTKKYDLAHVKEMRVSPLPDAPSRTNQMKAIGVVGGPIAFDYGAETIRFGAGVDEAEAKALVETIKRSYNV